MKKEGFQEGLEENEFPPGAPPAIAQAAETEDDAPVYTPGGGEEEEEGQVVPQQVLQGEVAGGWEPLGAVVGVGVAEVEQRLAGRDGGWEELL